MDYYKYAALVASSHTVYKQESFTEFKFSGDALMIAMYNYVCLSMSQFVLISIHGCPIQLWIFVPKQF